MNRVERRTETANGVDVAERLWFECPGCGELHAPRVNARRGDHPSWTWNGSLERPTLAPSLLVRWEYGAAREKRVCHSFIENGQIRFIDDCTHALKGRTVDLPELTAPIFGDEGAPTKT